MELNRDCDTVGKFTETASLMISHSMSTKIDKKIAARVTKTTQSPYLIKKHTQIAEFSVVTPEQSKHIKPVDMAIFGIIRQRDLELTAYLNELLRTNKAEQQNNKFWFPHLKTLESLKITPQYIQESSRNFVELNEKEKLNPQESLKSGNEFPKRFD